MYLKTQIFRVWYQATTLIRWLWWTQKTAEELQNVSVQSILCVLDAHNMWSDLVGALTIGVSLNPN
jgi:hypothetical protein